jgi:intracellular septation protein
MQMLFDFFPIFTFFIAFKLTDIYTATAVFLLATVVQMGIYWFKNRHFQQMHIITFILALVLGGATLLFHNELFMKWKPTAIYWAFAITFLFTQIVGTKPLIQRIMEASISLPRPIWHRLNLSWVLFFLVMGILNLYVVYHFSTNAWVNFKLFGGIGATIIFAIAQAFYLNRYAKAVKPIQ